MKFKIKTQNFFEHQRTWWNLPNYIKLLVGGYGCGKSYIAAMRAIYLSYLNSGTPGMLISPTYQMAKTTIIPHLLQIFDRSELNYDYNKTDHNFLIKNWDGEIYVRSGDNPISLRGPNLSWAGIDEPFVQDISVFEQAMARIRIGNHQELFLTGTPEQLNWGYEIAMNDEGKYDIGLVRGKTKDNPTLPQSYYDTLYNAYSPEMIKAYLDGEFVNLTAGRVYKPFDRAKHITHMDCQNLPICAGLDFNVDYMTAEIFYNGNGWVHFFDEIRLSNSNSFELSEILKQKYTGINVYPDASGSARKSSSTKSDHQIFRDAGFRVIAMRENPRVMDRVNSVNKLLMQDHLTIEPNRCKHLIQDLERNVFKNGDIDKQSDLALSHAGDAAGYGISYLYPIQTHRAAMIARN